MIKSNKIIKKNTFLSTIYGKIYPFYRWYEHTFCIKSLHHKLQSAYPLIINNPYFIEYINDINNKNEYNAICILYNNNLQLSQNGLL